MSHQDDIARRRQKSEQAERTIRLLRMVGSLLVIAGLLIFFDVGGLLGALDLTGSGHLIGAILMMAGVLDIFAAPRFLERLGQERQQR